MSHSAEGKEGSPAIRKSFVVATDGSEAAHKAFEAAKSLFTFKDHVTVLHCAVAGKEYLPRDLQPKAVKKTYEIDLVCCMPKERYEIVVFDRPERQTTHEAVCRMVNKLRADIMFVGFVGRKGIKEDPTILGTTSDYSLRAVHADCAVIKHRTVLVPDHRTPALWVVCVDGSPASENALRKALGYMRANDKLQALHVQDDAEAKAQENASAIEARVREIAEEGKRDLVFEAKVREAGMPVSAAVVDHCNNGTDANWIVLGRDGMTAHRRSRPSLGSVSDAVVRKAWAGVIVTTDAKRHLSAD